MEKLFGYFAAGDGPFYFAETIKKLGWLPVLWREDEGFGANHGFRLWYDYTLQLVIKILSSVGFNWWWIDKFLWFGVIAVAVYASYVFGKYFFKRPYAYLVPVIYVLNTYFLLLFSGGQLGVAWGYGLTPLVFLKFIDALDSQVKNTLRAAVVNGLLFALLIACDLRFAYVVFGAVVLYAIAKYYKKFSLSNINTLLFTLFVPLVIAATIHAFWILPTLFMGGARVGGLDSELTSPGMLRFLSFADFSHALSLLHPNWPENLFGKVYFLQPEFLVIPILAFSAFLFQKSKTDKKFAVVFFGLLAFIGIFFAKGVQKPFGGVYQWMFTHIPGFVMFRDPTKFYVYIALGYSVLIPFVLERIQKKAVIVVFVIVWLFTIRALFLGQVKGNFRPLQLPQEYIQLKDLLVQDSTPSRTLWIPQQEKFAYADEVHPLLYADELFPGASVSAITSMAGARKFMKTLADAGVGYVVVPEDVEQRLFLNDYRFDPKEREALIEALKKTQLVEDSAFHNVVVFKNNSFTFVATHPASLVRQQQLTNIGLVVSVISLTACAGVLAIRRKN